MKNLFNLFIALVFSLSIIGCKTKKLISLEEINTKYRLSSDSSYFDTINTDLTSFTSTVINFDSTGKPTTAIINKAFRESKNESKKGVVKKDIELKQEIQKVEKDIQKDGSQLFKINYTGLFFVGVIIALIIFLYNRK
ncbi:MAG: hypothetical protein EOO47_05055 [Flavobacterium sp.]|nr:MAG: hypothetical protein EOO47_05055 [Flavobacterium sp.]